MPSLPRLGILRPDIQEESYKMLDDRRAHGGASQIIALRARAGRVSERGPCLGVRRRFSRRLQNQVSQRDPQARSASLLSLFKKSEMKAAVVTIYLTRGRVAE